MKRADELMTDAVETYRARSKVYGGSYVTHGDLMAVLFPNGIELKSPMDFSRFNALNSMVVKLCRYTKDFATAPHQDSIHDLGVYSFIMEEMDQLLTREAWEERKQLHAAPAKRRRSRR